MAAGEEGIEIDLELLGSASVDLDYWNPSATTPRYDEPIAIRLPLPEEDSSDGCDVAGDDRSSEGTCPTQFDNRKKKREKFLVMVIVALATTSAALLVVVVLAGGGNNGKQRRRDNSIGSRVLLAGGGRGLAGGGGVPRGRRRQEARSDDNDVVRCNLPTYYAVGNDGPVRRDLRSAGSAVAADNNNMDDDELTSSKRRRLACKELRASTTRYSKSGKVSKSSDSSSSASSSKRSSKSGKGNSKSSKRSSKSGKYAKPSSTLLLTHQSETHTLHVVSAYALLPTHEPPPTPSPTRVLVPSPACPDDGRIICLRNRDYGEDDPTRYNIDLSIQVTTPTSVDAFVKARSRWMEIITQDLPGQDLNNNSGGGGGYVDDLRVRTFEESIDGPGGIVAQARVDEIRRDPSTGKVTSVAGIIRFDNDDVAMLMSSSDWEDVILHEMGHVIGFGLLWPANDLVNGTLGNLQSFDYLGAEGIRVWTDDWNCNATDAPPVDFFGTHWNECLRNEFMTGVGPPGPVSTLTLASLEDIGYTVDYALSEAFDGENTSCCFPTTTDLPPASTKPPLSEESRKRAIANGKQVLNGSPESADEAVAILVRQGDYLYDVFVTNSE